MNFPTLAQRADLSRKDAHGSRLHPPPRHIIVPLVIGRQPDLLGGPTVTHERAVKPTPQTWSRDMRRYLRATSSNPDR
jgi:hypothetical protein